MEAENQGASIDFEFLVAWETFGGKSDAKLFTEVVETFLHTSVSTFEKMQGALESEDRNKLAQATHKLRGSSANFGAVRLARLCAKLENSLAQGALPKNLPAFLKQIETELFEARRILKQRYCRELEDLSL